MSIYKGDTLIAGDGLTYTEQSPASGNPSPLADYYNKNAIDTQLSAKANNTLNNLGSINPTLTTTTETNAGKNGTKYSGGHFVIASWKASDETMWYRIWSDGWKECGVVIKNGGVVNLNKTITIPLSFTSSNYLILRTNSATSSNTVTFRAVGVSGKALNSFVASFSDMHYDCYFYCCGY